MQDIEIIHKKLTVLRIVYKTEPGTENKPLFIDIKIQTVINLQFFLTWVKNHSLIRSPLLLPA